MALALYRKYRPRTFAEVIGQEHVTEPLSQALRSGRLNHAYLFSGPRGCGKTSSARILARSLNCEQGPTPEPCGVCTSCRSLANDGTGSIDVIEIDAASHGGVDDARELREKAFFAPANSRYKIYVIDEAHMVSSAGFNALLKLVEEPPEYVKFIFATTEPDKVLGTIRSRTHHYPFRLIPPATLRPYLQTLTEAEGVHVEPAVFPLVVRAGGGSARDTLSVLDQLIAGAGPDGVSYARAVALLGVTDAALIDEMCDALADGDGAAAYETIDRVAEAGHDARRYASDLLERLRDLIILQQVPDAVAKGLIDGPADQLEAMHGQAARLGAATLSRCADIVHNGLVEMRGTTAPRLLLELITARMMLPGADDSTGALLQRLERLERHGPPQGPSDAAGPAVVAAAASDVRDESAAAPLLDNGGGGKAAARAAALAAGRRAAGGPAARPVSPAPSGPGAAQPAAAPPVPEADSPAAAPTSPAEPAVPVEPAVPAAPAAPVEPAGATVAAEPAVAGARAEADWNQVAAGEDRADAEYYDDEPPWDEEPPADPEPAVPPRPRAGFPQVRDVWQAFGPKNPTIRAMQDNGIGLRAVDGDTVFFSAPTPRYAERFLTYTDLITTEFSDELGGRWQIRCEVGDASADAPARSATDRGRGQAADRDQSASRRVSAGPSARPAPAAAPSAAPERNPGRTESRPSRPQRAPAADADDDWPAPEPSQSSPDHPDSTRSQGVAASSDAGYSRSPAGHPDSGRPQGLADRPDSGYSRGTAERPDSGRSRGLADRADSSAGSSVSAEAVTGSNWPAAPAVAPVGTADDADWPEPVRPGTAALKPATPQADDDWPEPVKPGAGANIAPMAGSQGAATPRAGAATPSVSAFAPQASPAAQASPGADLAQQGTTPGSGDHPGSGSATTAALGPGSAGADSSPTPVAHAAADPATSVSTTAPFGAVSVSPASSGGASAALPGEASADVAPTARPGAAPPTPGTAPGAGSVSGTASGAGSTPGVPSGAGSAPGAVSGSGAVPASTASSVPPRGGPAPAASPGAGAPPSVPAVPARSAAMEAARAAAARGGNAAPNSGLAAARAAARNAGGNRPAGGPAAAQSTGSSGGSAWADGTPIGEAPYDPDYDGPPAAGAGFEGFDPGDEPLDEVIDEKTARQSSEEQALQLLREAFGAEKIGEL